MDINVLVIEVGHTRLKLGRFEAGELRYVTRIDVSQHEDWQGVIEEAWRPLSEVNDAEVAAAATYPAMRDLLSGTIHNATGSTARWFGVGQDLPPPFAVRTREPGKTGVDRLLNVAAAYEQLGKACCVVDAGSAVTVDFCDDAGTFLGGVIAPGLRAQAEALHRLAPHIPELRVSAAPVGAWGDDTESAATAGLVHGIRGLVREVVERHAMTLDAWPEVIATGGDAAMLFSDWEVVHAVSPDLTLYGLALAYAEAHSRR